MHVKYKFYIYYANQNLKGWNNISNGFKSSVILFFFKLLFKMNETRSSKKKIHLIYKEYKFPSLALTTNNGG
jgi:hypothetical protein